MDQYGPFSNNAINSFLTTDALFFLAKKEKVRRHSRPLYATSKVVSYQGN
jgi:hypothetical protein